MPRRREAAPKKPLPTFNFTIPTLLGILSLVFTMWSHLQGGAASQARESGAVQSFREQEMKTDEVFREALRRIADRLTTHERESEAEHREMRRDLENEFRRDVDANCGTCKERRK